MRTSNRMKSLLALVVSAACAYAGWQFLKSAKRKQNRRELKPRIETWEGEGGAVPVARGRTAAQISPQNPP